MATTSDNTQTNPPSKPPGVVTRIRGVFEAAHGICEKLRGKTLEAIDNVTMSGTPETKSRHASIVDRGRTEVQIGIAHIQGLPDPHAGEIFHKEPDSLPQPATGIPGSGHTTGTGPRTDYMHTGERDYYGGGGGVGNVVGRGASGYGTDGGYGGQSPYRTFQNAVPEIDAPFRS